MRNVYVVICRTIDGKCQVWLETHKQEVGYPIKAMGEEDAHFLGITTKKRQASAWLKRVEGDLHP